MFKWSKLKPIVLVRSEFKRKLSFRMLIIEERLKISKLSTQQE